MDDDRDNDSPPSLLLLFSPRLLFFSEPFRLFFRGPWPCFDTCSTQLIPKRLQREHIPVALSALSHLTFDVWQAEQAGILSFLSFLSIEMAWRRFNGTSVLLGRDAVKEQLRSEQDRNKRDLGSQLRWIVDKVAAVVLFQTEVGRK